MEQERRLAKEMDNAEPFFSIVLPVYNVEKYLGRCIESILKQDFENYEILLIDDGSRECCAQLCEQWAKQNSRIRVIHKKNAGLGMARNTGLDNARGQYIFFIDSDDYILPGMLSAVWCVICKNHSECVFYGFERRNKAGKKIFELKPTPAKNYYSNGEEIKNQLLPDFIARNPYTGKSANLRISAWNCGLSVSFLRNNNLRFVSEREFISEDIYFYVELFSHLNKATIIEDVYYCYCQNEGSLTYSYKPDRFARLKDFQIKIEKLADQLNYDGEVQLRLKESFIANTMGCLKMEVGQLRKYGVRQSFKKMKLICTDAELRNTLLEYPLDKYEKSWRVFADCIINKHYILLYLILLMRYLLKGI